MKKYTVIAIGLIGVVGLACIASIMGIVYLAMKLYAINPAYPGMIAFVIGGAAAAYLFLLNSYKSVIAKLAELDLKGEQN